MNDSVSARPHKRPTLEDVGARAGVSRALVSIVMRGVPGASAETRERVLQVAAEMGYRPDARARLLASNSSPLLGVVFSQFGVFHLELLDGLYSTAEQLGCDVILSALTTHRDERRAVETLQDFRCDAVILLGPEGGTPVLAGRLPVTVVGWRVKDPAVDVVRSSDSQGARQAVDHLVDLGHTEIIHVDGGRGSVSVARRSSYRAAMRRNGLEPQVRASGGGFTQEDGVRAAQLLLQEPSLPTAIVAFNDDIAAGVLETFRAAGLQVPQAISIVGWNDSSLSRLPHLDLTTVRQDPNEMARLAVERSVERVTGAPVTDREVVLPTELIVRSSTGPPSKAAEDVLSQR